LRDKAHEAIAVLVGEIYEFFGQLRRSTGSSWRSAPGSRAGLALGRVLAIAT